MLTSDPIYNKPYKPAIYINNTSNSTNYYTFDPWTDTGTTNKPIHLSLSLSENTHGKFVCQIEDGGRTLNRSNINKGARLIIKVGKYSGQMTQVLSGLIRETADSRGGDRKDLYTLIGSSTSIRNNERVIYFVRQAAKLTSTGEIDINDPAMKAVLLLNEAYQSTRSVSPQSIGAEGSGGIINISSMVANSNVLNFIADVNIEFGEIQDAVNMIEEQSGSEYVVSSTDIANLRYELTRVAGGRGFTIKNKTYRITGIDDDADDTMYLIKKNWKYSDSCYKDASYSNRLSGILASDNQYSDLASMGYPGGSANYSNGGTSNPDSTHSKEIAVKFRPTHSHCLPGDFMVGFSADYSEPGGASPYTPRFRIAKDSGGVPQNVSGIVVNIDFPGQSNPKFTPRLGDPQNFFSPSGSSILSFDLDTTKDYWFILSAVGSTSTVPFASVAWLLATTIPKFATIASAPRFTTNNSDGGSGWSILGITTKPLFEMPRRRSQALVMHDPKAIKNLGSGLVTGGTIIETHLPSFPSIIKTTQAGYSYMANQLYYMAKPRANYAIPQVTAPNILPLPGDPIVISDTILGFSTSGNKVILTRCGDMSLSWGALDGSGFTYEAPTKLNINPVGNIPRYK